MEQKRNSGKVVIVGSGFVGAAAAFAITMAGIVAEIVVVDINREKAKGEALDISHGLSFASNVRVSNGGFEEVKNADIIVVTAGSARKPGETRLDLVRKNDVIARDITRNIMEYYNGGIILVVSNPVDILTYIIQDESGLPASKVFGSGTSLDTSRFRYLIGNYYDVNVKDVNGFIIGEHGDSMVPVWSHVNIQGIHIDEFNRLSGKVLDKTQIEGEVKTAGAKVIQLKGATYYAIAMSISRIVEAIIQDQNAVIPVGSVLNGIYGICDVALSLPCIINSSGISRVIDIDITNDEKHKLISSADKMKEVLSQIDNSIAQAV